MGDFWQFGIRIMGAPGVIADRNPESGFALTKANYPCLMEAFTDTGISGNDNVGVLGTVTLTSSGGWTLPASNQFTRTSGTLTCSGTWEAIGNRSALAIMIGNFVDGAVNLVRLGDNTNGPVIALGGGTTTPACKFNASNLATSPATSLSGNLVAAAVHLDQAPANGNFLAYWHDGSTSEGPINPLILTGDISQNWSAFSTAATSAFSPASTTAGIYFTGIYYLAFNTFPTDISVPAALLWMHNHPKKLYPGFYRRS